MNRFAFQTLREDYEDPLRNFMRGYRVFQGLQDFQESLMEVYGMFSGEFEGETLGNPISFFLLSLILTLFTFQKRQITQIRRICLRIFKISALENVSRGSSRPFRQPYLYSLTFYLELYRSPLKFPETFLNLPNPFETL